MTSSLDEIVIGHGLTSVYFGCSIADAKKTLGDPTREYSTDYGDIILEYDKEKLTLTFWKSDDYSLGNIGSKRKYASILGNRLIGLSEKSIRQFISDELKTSITEVNSCIHKDGSVQTWFDVDAKSIIFWFSDGILESIDWAPI